MPDDTSLYDQSILIRLLSGESDELLAEKVEIKYVIYARKSREEDDRQIRSIADQVSECQRLADLSGFRVVATLVEAVSAKESDKREKFNEMVERLNKGELQGVIAWHPDRLSRNMKEAGLIVDLLDKGIIKDLKFPSFTYENTTMGKVMLSIAFAISKQYSDKLSEDVKRGNRKIAGEGKRIGRAKPGYFKDEDKFLRPDGKNHDLIVEAFKMRLKGEPQETIRQFLIGQGLTVRNYQTSIPKRIKITNTKVSNILRDPVYAGVLKTGSSLIDLVGKYDFVTAVSVDDFLKMNHFNSLEKIFRQKVSAPGQKAEANLMRKMVRCGYCNENLVAGITPKKNNNGFTWYYYFRCDTPGCKALHKSVRAKVLIDYACEFLRGFRFDNPKLYSNYKQELGVVNKNTLEKKKAERSQLLRCIALNESKIVRIKELIVNTDDQSVRVIFESDLKTELANVEAQKESLKLLDKKIKEGEVAPLTHEQFIELMNNLPDEIAKTTDMKQLDYKIRKIFLNFTVKDKKVLLYTLQSPFKEFVENGLLSKSRGAQN